MPMDRERESFVSRRAFVTATAATLAMGGAAAAAGMPSTDPDAPIREAAARLHGAKEEAYAAWLAVEDAGDRYVGPPLPEALYCRGEDRALDMPLPRRCDADRPAYDASAVARLRNGPRRREVSRPPTEAEIARGHQNWHLTYAREPWPEAQARANEIVAAWAAHDEAQDAAEEACGLAAAQRMLVAAQARRNAAVAALAAARATTPAGAALKAEAVRSWFDDDEALDETIAGDNIDTDARIALSIVRDMLRMGQA